MAVAVTAFHHTNVRVPRALEAETKHFYGAILGLTEVLKPAASRPTGGAWYQIGSNQIHLSLDDTASNTDSKRHICLLVADLDEAKRALTEQGVAVIPDPEPIEGNPRFYVRDPGDNLIEIAQSRN